MSHSPRESEDVEPQHTSSADENDQIDKSESRNQPKTTDDSEERDEPRQADPNQPDGGKMDETGYDFEVKEQDRWLPIANGESLPIACASHIHSICLVWTMHSTALHDAQRQGLLAASGRCGLPLTACVTNQASL